MFRRKGGGRLPSSLVVRCATQPDIYSCVRYRYTRCIWCVVWVGVCCCSRELMRLSRVQHNRSDDKDAINTLLSCVFFIVVDSHQNHFHSSGYCTRDEIWLRTFVSRDRNWIKNIGLKTHNKCNILCIRVRLLTAFGFEEEEEEEECSSQDDPLAVVHLDLSREAF